MDKKISKKERDYILYNIRGFFKHYKIEQNINKISIDIINLQKMQEEMNILLKEFNEYKEEFNSPILINRTKLKVNKKNKFITKSSDKINKKKEKLKLNDFKYDLNKSNLTLRPKTPDVSNIFNKYKKKKYNTNIGNKLSNGNLFNKNPIKIESNSFNKDINQHDKNFSFLNTLSNNESIDKSENLIEKNNENNDLIYSNIYKIKHINNKSLGEKYFRRKNSYKKKEIKNKYNNDNNCAINNRKSEMNKRIKDNS